MTNTTVLEMLIRGYNRHAYTDKYIIGFAYKGTIYAGFTTAETIDRYLILDSASRGAGYSLKFKPHTDEKIALLTACDMEPIASKKFFEDLVADSKYNRGEIFEKLITEKFNQIWKKDNVPFTDAGDIVINGIHYQIKYEKATFISEKGLKKIGG